MLAILAAVIVFVIVALATIFIAGKSNTPTAVGGVGGDVSDSGDNGDSSDSGVTFYYAEWCGSCQALKPILEEAKKSPKLAGIVIKEVDTDKEWSPDSITSVPTLIKGGKVYDNDRDVEKMIDFIVS